MGIAGVAPGVTLVNIRAGQDSGFFFLQPTVDALTYAGDRGIDVVNMSFFTDPWLFNCRANPADSPAEQAEQRDDHRGDARALDYARDHGVTLVAALGNENTDLGNPTIDDTSPDYPPGTRAARTMDNTCLAEPTEARRHRRVGAVGPSRAEGVLLQLRHRADRRVGAGRRLPRLLRHAAVQRARRTRILNAYPLNVARACGEVDAAGVPNGLTTCTANAVAGTRRAVPLVRDCANGTCALYQWIQGTSMAAPHAVGVAALIVAQLRHGRAAGVDRALRVGADHPHAARHSLGSGRRR